MTTAKEEFKPVNKLRACILERKFTTKMTWMDIGLQAGVSPNTLKYLMANVDPWEWDHRVLDAVCNVLGIQMKTILIGWDDY